jgi:hypothetical protein
LSPWLRFDAAPDVADVPPCCDPAEDPGRVPLVLSVYTGVVAVPWPAAPPAGVGSNLSQPKPWKYSSGQACASCEVTTHSLPATGVPEVKPIATRAGMPSSRASAAMAKENCWQYPRFVCSRKFASPLSLMTVGAFSVYRKPPPADSQSWSATASWNAVFAPAAFTTDCARPCSAR